MLTQLKGVANLINVTQPSNSSWTKMESALHVLSTLIQMSQAKDALQTHVVRIKFLALMENAQSVLSILILILKGRPV